MVVIRLSPSGRKGDLVYKITVCSKAAKLTGKYIEKLGIYKVGTQKDVFAVKTDRLNYWLSKGAQTSPSLLKVFRDNKVELYQAPLKAAKPKAAKAKPVKAAAPATKEASVKKEATKEAPAKKAATAAKKK